MSQQNFFQSCIYLLVSLDTSAKSFFLYHISVLSCYCILYIVYFVVLFNIFFLKRSRNIYSVFQCHI